MQLSEFNHAHTDEIIQRLKHCVQIERWAQQIATQRPFPSKQALINYAKLQSTTWSWSEILAALAAHPRIGEKQAQAALTEKELNFSKQEQAAIAVDQATQSALLAGNLAYEQKFDFIFLIRAAGRNSQEVLTALTQRLQHDLATEQGIVHQQLSEIALFRLTQEITT